MKFILLLCLIGAVLAQKPKCCRCQAAKADVNSPYGPKCNLHNSGAVSSFCPNTAWNPADDWPFGTTSGWVLRNQNGPPHVCSNDGRFVCDPGIALTPCAGKLKGDPCGSGKTCQTAKPPATGLTCQTKPPPPPPKGPCTGVPVGKPCNKPATGTCTYVHGVGKKCISGPCAGKRSGAACAGSANTVGNQCKVSGGTLKCLGQPKPCVGASVGSACKTHPSNFPGTCQKSPNGGLQCVTAPCFRKPYGASCSPPSGGKCTNVNGNKRCINGPCAGLRVGAGCNGGKGKCYHNGKGGLYCKTILTGCAVYRGQTACWNNIKCMWKGGKCVTKVGCPWGPRALFSAANVQRKLGKMTFPGTGLVKFQGGGSAKYTGRYLSKPHPMKGSSKVMITMSIRGGGSLDHKGGLADYAEIDLIIDGKTVARKSCKGWGCPRARTLSISSTKKGNNFQINIQVRLTGRDEWLEFGSVKYAVCP